jgi:RNA polymerase sigma factor (sigma-70 family)
MDDRELLTRYVQGKEDAAFGELVGRHRDWVYSVCLRRLRDEGLAEDATQVVFMALAREARRLAGHQTIAGWLHRVSRYTAMKIRRDEARRIRRERQAGAMRVGKDSGEQAAGANWEAMEQVLEQSLDALRAGDREAILLRFYRQLSHADVRTALGISEEAAKKRVNRAVERLRAVIGARGVHTTTDGIGTAMLAYGVTAAPAGTAAGLVGIVKGAVSGKVQALTHGVLQMMGHVKLAVTAGWVVAALAVVGVAAVPLMHGHGALPQVTVAASAPAATPLVEAEQREVAALREVLRGIDNKMQIVSITPEFLQMRQQWMRQLAKVQMRLADGPAARLAVAEDWLTAARDFNRRIQDRRLVDAGEVELYGAQAYVAEAEVVVERVKSGESGDVGL